MKAFLLLFLITTIAYADSLLSSSQRYIDSELAMPSDSVCLACERTTGVQRMQWLIVLSTSSRRLNEGEKSKSWIEDNFQHTVHCSTGRDYVFPDDPFAMDIQMIGPFQDTAAAAKVLVPKVTERVIANGVYFNAGIFPTAKIFERLLQQGHSMKGITVQFPSPSYSAEQIQAARSNAIAIGLGIEEEREFARSFAAMIKFGMMAGRLKAFREVLGSVMDLPGIFNGLSIYTDWSKLRRRIEPNSISGLGETYEVPISLHTKSWLSGTIRFVRPVGPLQYCAGLTEIDFMKSEKAPHTTVKIWVLCLKNEANK